MHSKVVSITTRIFLFALLLSHSGLSLGAAPTSDAESAWGDHSSAWGEEHCVAVILRARDRMQREMTTLGEQYRLESQSALDDLFSRMEPALAGAGDGTEAQTLRKEYWRQHREITASLNEQYREEKREIEAQYREVYRSACKEPSQQDLLEQQIAERNYRESELRYEIWVSSLREQQRWREYDQMRSELGPASSDELFSSDELLSRFMINLNQELLDNLAPLELYACTTSMAAGACDMSTQDLIDVATDAAMETRGGLPRTFTGALAPIIAYDVHAAITSALRESWILATFRYGERRDGEADIQEQFTQIIDQRETTAALIHELELLRNTNPRTTSAFEDPD